MKRRSFVALIGGGLAAPLAAFAQPSGRVLRIAWLEDGWESSSMRGAFLKRLGELGYAEGRNLTVEARYARAANERLPALAAELVARKPDILVAISTPPAQALKQATSTIPIVFVGPVDPVGAGLIASLARPGGNATGLLTMTAEIGPKYIELLRELAPQAKRIAFLADTGNKGSHAIFGRLRKAAEAAGLSVRFFDGRGGELERSLAAMARERYDGLFVGATTVLLDRQKQIVQFAAENRIPAIYARREYAAAGGLLYYGTDRAPMYRRAAEYVHRIAQGARPADLPVEQPNDVRMVVNLKAARTMGITIPKSIAVRADEVIE